MDISNITPVDTIKVDQLYDNDGERIVDEKTGKPASIEMYGPNTDVYAEAVAEMAREQQQGNAGRKKGEEKELTGSDVKQTKRRSIGMLSRVVKSWTGFYDGGKKIEASPENVARALTLLPLVRQRLDKTLGDETAFFRKSANS